MLNCLTLGLLDPEDKGNTILWTVGNYWPNDVASHSRRIKLRQHDYENLTLYMS